MRRRTFLEERRRSVERREFVGRLERGGGGDGCLSVGWVQGGIFFFSPFLNLFSPLFFLPPDFNGFI